MNFAGYHRGIGDLRAHLNDFDVEPIVFETLPFLRGEKMQAANRRAGNRDSDFCFALLSESDGQETDRPDQRSACDSNDCPSPAGRW